MAQFEIVLPRMGEGITDATLIRWLKKTGDEIAEEEALAEVATDKVDSEIPSSVAGVVKELLFEEGDVIEVGKVIAIITTEQEVPANSSVKKEEAATLDDKEEKPQEESDRSEIPQKGAIPITLSGASGESLPAKGSSGRFYSPLVRNIAKQEGVTIEELDSLEGSGKESRITKDDLLKYLSNRTAPQKTATTTSSATSAPPQPILPLTTDGDQVVEMTRMRKLIADHMVFSRNTSVHVTSVVEIDVTNLVNWRNKYKTIFEKREGEKLTFTPIFIWAIAKTLREYPMLNASVDNNKIIVKKNINLGLAAALPDGNLIVPVIRDADHKNLLALAKIVNDLAKRARINKLQPDEIKEGTFTLTNVGSFDTLFATPIINQPQVGILAVGAIKKKPVVLETDFGDTIAIRSMMYLSMSYDHRVVDGALGGMALKRIGEYLQNWDSNQTI